MRAGPSPLERRVAELEAREAEVQRQLVFILALLRDRKYGRIRHIVESLLIEPSDVRAP